MHIQSQIVFFLFLELSVFSQKTMSGRISDANGRKLEGVSIVLGKQHIVGSSDKNGNFKIEVGSDTLLCFTQTGFNDTCISIDNSSNNLQITINEKVIHANEVIISSSVKRKNILSAQTGLIEIRPDSLKFMPSLLGEADPMKMLQLTPGVSKSDVSMGLNIRGCSSDQNLVLLDGATVYNPTHLAGFLSVFNPLTVEKVSLIKSGIPANFGGRLSSIIEISTQTAIPDSTQMALNAGLLMSDFSVKTPLLNGKMGVSIAARKSYIDLSIKPAAQLIMKKSPSFFLNTSYGFYDINAGINTRLTNNDILNIGFYTGSDDYLLHKASFDVQNAIGWTNTALSARWSHVFSASHIMKSKASYSANKFMVHMGQNDFFFEMESKINDLSLLHEHTLYSNWGTFKVGIELVSNNVSPNQSKANLNDFKIDFGTINHFQTLTSSAYMQAEYKIGEKILLANGLRVNYYLHYGPYDEFSRNENREITDTLHFASNQKVKSYIDLEPRVSVRYLLSELASLKFSCTRNVQYLHQVNVSAVAFPTDFWLPSTGKILPQRAWQFSGGYYTETYSGNINAYAEVFYKPMHNLTEFASGILNSLTRATMEENLLTGSGRSYGIEFLVQQHNTRFNVWLSYTLSRTERMFDEINNGRAFPAKYDRTHDISVSLSYKLNNKWQFSSVFIYATGNAMTIPIGRYMVGGNIVNQYSNYNSFRMPAYHRLDISATRTFKSKGKRVQNLNIGIYNVYNRQNPYYMFFSLTGDLKNNKLEVKPKFVSLYPILPSISYEYRF